MTKIDEVLKTPEHKTEPVPPENYHPATAKALTSDSENWSGSFSPDGRRIIFLSKNRPKHQHSQVYELDRLNYKQKRITYHDGENGSPRFDPSGQWILYSSTTDEIKEDPVFIQKSLNRFAGSEATANHLRSPQSTAPWLAIPFELYRSTPQGNKIERLTNSHKYDSEGMYHPTLPTILFTSVRRGRSQLYMMNLDGSSVRPLSQGNAIEGEGSLHPGGSELVFVRYSEDMKSGNIVFRELKKNQEKVLTNGAATNWSPTWHPDGERILFSSNQDTLDNFELYLIKKDGSCLQRLTYSLGDDIEPAISPDGKSILFTSNRSGMRQLYIMDFQPPSACTESAT